jgi:hypothetical protein
MTGSLQDLIAYIVKNYPHPSDLSNARVTKMVYLADWFSLINEKGSLSNINWYFDNYGPFVWDIKRCVEASNTLQLVSTRTMFGNKKELIELRDNDYEPTLSEDAARAIDHIIKQTEKLNWTSFIRLVYSTYPIAKSEKYSQLDLPVLASEYRASQQI